MSGGIAIINGDGSLTVVEATSDYTVQAVVKNSEGETISSSEVETIHIKQGFFSKLIAFFKSLFGILPQYDQK